MGVIAMKKTGLIMILMLSAAVLFGCAEKKPPAQEAKEPASQSAESAGEKPAEIKEAPPAAAPAPAPEAKAVEENAPPPAAVEETPVKKEPAEVKGAAAGAAIYKSKCSPCPGPGGLCTPLCNTCSRLTDAGERAAARKGFGARSRTLR